MSDDPKTKDGEHAKHKAALNTFFQKHPEEFERLAGQSIGMGVLSYFEAKTGKSVRLSPEALVQLQALSQTKGIVGAFAQGVLSHEMYAFAMEFGEAFGKQKRAKADASTCRRTFVKNKRIRRCVLPKGHKGKCSWLKAVEDR